MSLQSKANVFFLSSLVVFRFRDESPFVEIVSIGVVGDNRALDDASDSAPRVAGEGVVISEETDVVAFVVVDAGTGMTMTTRRRKTGRKRPFRFVR